MTHSLEQAQRLFEEAIIARGAHLSAIESASIDAMSRMAHLCSTFATFTSIQSPSEPVPYTTSAASALAGDIRGRLGMDDASPIFELASLIPAHLGAIVFPISCPDIASACIRLNQRSIIFISKGLGFEMLSACAVELSNILTLSSRSNEANFASITPKSLSWGRGPREYFAANFGMDLLIPTRGLGIALRTVRALLKVKSRAIGDIEMLYIARIFGVSFSIVARKCERSQLLPPGGATTLERFIAEKFGDPEKRADELGLPERPVIHVPPVPTALIPAIGEAVRMGSLSRAEIARILAAPEEVLTLILRSANQELDRLWQ